MRFSIFTKVLQIGCGNMGGSLLPHWLKGQEEFTIVDPGLEGAPEGTRLLADRIDIADETFDVVIVAIKPQLIESVLPAYAPNIAKGGYVLSIAAGASIAKISAAMGGAPVLRTMPNLPAVVGRGVSTICAGDGLSDGQLDHAGSMMERAGTVVTVEDEDMLDRATAVAGSGPGYIFELARAYVSAAEKLGFKYEDARKLVLGTMDGSVAVALDQAETELADIRNSVTSKGGTTAAGLDALNGDGKISQRFEQCLGAAYDRAVQLR